MGTIQNLNKILLGNTTPQELVKNSMPADTVLFSTNNKAAYEKKLASLKRDKLFANQWIKAQDFSAMDEMAGYTAVKLMYRDADLMDTSEIGTALDIVSEEATCTDGNGKMLFIKSKSPRIKSILEDLFINRLAIHTNLPHIVRDVCKYGNSFQLLNISEQNGVMGWRDIKVYDIDRVENGISPSYGLTSANLNNNEIRTETVKFVWIGHDQQMPFNNYQIAHFRLLNDAFFLPYGTSMLHKARRAWRMWSMMEDSMFIYRLDKSIERRVFKIYVGGIDDDDVQAYVQQIANNFKRTPIIDPQTGQVDLRKNFMDVSTDYFIPVRDENAPTPIDTLRGANNQTSMDDIQYMQNKIFAAMRVPKTFLNFQEAQGKGQNLSLMDVRFARMVNKIQQFILAELNKIAIIHLYFLGFRDDLTNFSLSLNNPSAQIEALELESLTKKLGATSQALTDPGIGMPLVSWHWAMKNIMKMDDQEIKNILEEIRLEKAMAAELATTQNIIKKTGIFDAVDNIYGDFDAMDAPANAQSGNGEGDEGGLGGGGGAAGFGGDMGMDMDGLGEPGGDEEGDLGGEEAAGDMDNAPDMDAGGPPMESTRSNKPLIFEQMKQNAKSFTEAYLKRLQESYNEEEGINDEPIEDVGTKVVTINNKINELFSKIDSIVENNSILTEEKDKDDDIIDDNVIAAEEL